MVVRSLSFHASYGCRHSGACCTSNWPIPIEADRLARVRIAAANGGLRAPDSATWSDDGGDVDLLPVVAGRCAFYDAGARRCAIQRTLGHDALPLACRQFPRVTLWDPRGVSVTLSHYCPTAAATLDDAAPVAISDAPAAFPPAGEYEGLDARHSLPPLLRPDMLMDWDSWWEFERLAIDLLGNSGGPVERSLRRLRRIIDVIRPWHPGADPLIARVRRAFESRELMERESSGRPDAPVEIRNFVCAHAFANWTAHLGLGLRTWLRSVEAAHELATSVGIRQADLTLRHLSNPKECAEVWSRIETG